MSAEVAPDVRQMAAGLRPGLTHIRGSRAVAPDLTVVIPVNARKDLAAVAAPLEDLTRYAGRRRVEVVLVVNNYPPSHTPPEVDDWRAAGCRVVAEPTVWREGEAVCLSARAPGIRAAVSQAVVLFDADCHIPDPTALLDWYADTLAAGAGAAYSHVDYYDVAPLASVRVKVAVHHLVRGFKRNVLRLPTTRGSNYAVRRSLFLDLYDEGLVADDLNVGPTVRWSGGRVVYGRRRSLHVLTSGRHFKGGWGRLVRQFRYRLLYNVRMLPVRSNTSRHPYHARNLR